MNYNKKEDFEYCKRVCKELEMYASNNYCKCSECGQVIKIGLRKCSKCGANINDIDMLTLYDYFEDFLDVEYIVDSKGGYISSKIYITLGGPTVWIDTATAEVKLRWASDKASYPFSFDICDKIDEIFEEYYNNIIN